MSATDAPGNQRPPGGRARWVRIGAVVLAAAVLIGIPLWLTSQPGFFGRYPGLAEKYTPWSTSTHLEAGCEGCHVPPTALARAGYRTRMVGEFYVSLVNRTRIPAVFSAPTNQACLSCHSDLRSVSPKGDLQIPHRAHVTILKMQCIECHDYLVHELSPEGKHTPPMVGCMECHDGDKAKDSCSACHTEKAAPPSHASGDWLVAHGDQAGDPECESCHKWADDWCVDCHSQRPTSHGSDWRAVHGDVVKQHRSCEACHDAAFCVRCHGVVPQDNFDPSLELVE